MILYPQNGDVVKGVSKNLQVVYKAKKPDGADNFLVGKIVGTPFDKFLNSWYNNGAMNNLGLFIGNFPGALLLAAGFLFPPVRPRARKRFASGVIF